MPARAFPCSAKPIACPPLRRATLAFALEPTKPRWLDGWTVGSCGSGGGLACSCGPCKLMEPCLKPPRKEFAQQRREARKTPAKNCRQECSCSNRPGKLEANQRSKTSLFQLVRPIPSSRVPACALLRRQATLRVIQLPCLASEQPASARAFAARVANGWAGSICFPTAPCAKWHNAGQCCQSRMRCPHQNIDRRLLHR